MSLNYYILFLKNIYIFYFFILEKGFSHFSYLYLVINNIKFIENKFTLIIFIHLKVIC